MTDQNLSDEIKKRVLVLDPQTVTLAEDILPGSLYETVAGDPLKPNKRYYHQYDYVFSFLLLQLAWNQDTEMILKAWYKCLRPGGRLYIFVPAIEWAIENYNIDDPPLHWWHHLHGWDKKKPHLASFNMKLLRADCARAGLIVSDAKTGLYGKEIEGVEYTAGSHFISVTKPEIGEEV